MNHIALNHDDKDTLEPYERDEWIPVKEKNQALQKSQQYDRNTLAMDHNRLYSVKLAIQANKPLDNQNPSDVL